MTNHEDTKAQGASGADKAKLTLAIVLAIGGIAAYYVLGDQPGWMRWLAVAAGFLLGIGAFMWSQYGRDFWQFVQESRIELRKVVWPNRQETGMTTVVVFGFVVVAGLSFWLVDTLLAWATRALTGQGD